MRWDPQQVSNDALARLPGYSDASVRHFDAPEAVNTRFYEVAAKSILNRVPEASQMAFRWTVNPYRGCAHACTYCFARPTHQYLGWDAGRDFEREIVVKVNAPELLRVELGRPRWQHEHVALVFWSRPCVASCRATGLRRGPRRSFLVAVCPSRASLSFGDGDF